MQADRKQSLRGNVLEAAIKEDLETGLIPFFVVATLGTTSSCAFDRLDEVGPVANKYDIWTHVDAVCPEYRYLMKGMETVDSFNFNPHKLLLVGFDCSAMWFRDSSWMVDGYNVDPVYLRYEMEESSRDAPDFRHWQIPFGRRFRALKLWFVLRLYGVEKLQSYLRGLFGLAKKFEGLCKEDERFEIFGEVILGLVCFRLRGGNELNEKLWRKINERKKIHLVPSQVGEVFFLRVSVSSRLTTEEDIEFAWKEVAEAATEVLRGD